MYNETKRKCQRVLREFSILTPIDSINSSMYARDIVMRFLFITNFKIK